jgi:hypothetical protein
VGSAAPFHITADPETKPLPLTVRVNVGLPAYTFEGASEVMVGVGLEPGLVLAVLILKVDAADAPPPGAGLLTVTLAVLALVMSEPGTETVSCEALTYFVASAAPFQFTADAETKLLPFTVRVKVVPPAVTLEGTSDAIAGTGLGLGLPVLLISKLAALDVPPPGAGLLTVTLALPALVMSEAGTAAVSCESLTYVVVNAAPFQFTADAATKPLPFTVRVKAEPPVSAAAGDSDARVGTEFGDSAVVVDAEVSVAAVAESPPAPSQPLSSSPAAATHNR